MQRRGRERSTVLERLGFMQDSAFGSRLRWAGILLGIGLGGFFDGIVLHQILQWHHMLTSQGNYPADTVAGLQVNTLWDGLFHAVTYVATAAGLFLLWSAARQPHNTWSTKLLLGLLLMGWGSFNLVEGLVDHQILGIHHVNETVPSDQWIWWDLAFLLWGAVMLIGGWALARASESEQATPVTHEAARPSRGPAVDPATRS
jgi:uncharacterized membrane protein